MIKRLLVFLIICCGLFLPVVTLAAPQQLSTTYLISDTNLKAYYQLENVNDYFTSWPLTNNNSVTFTSGLFANAANFGVASSHKSLSQSDLGIAGNSALSIMGWMYITAQPATNTYYMVWEHSTTNGVANYVQLRYRNVSGVNSLALVTNSTFAVSYTVTIPLNTWEQVAVTRDASNNVDLYYNGASVGTAAEGTVSDTNNAFTLGTDALVDNWYTGQIDDVGVFNRVVTSGEIACVYNGTCAGSGGSTSTIGYPTSTVTFDDFTLRYYTMIVTVCACFVITALIFALLEIWRQMKNTLL